MPDLHLEAVLTGQSAGDFDLPPTILSAAAVRKLLSDKLAQTRTEDPAPAMLADLAAKAVAAAAKGKVPDGLGKPLVDSELAIREQQAAVSVLEAAVDQANADLRAAFRDNVRVIVTGYLRPAVVDTLATVRKVAPSFANGVPPSEAVGHLSVDAAEAWHVLDGATRRYGAIRVAQFHVEQFGGPGAQPRSGDLFGEFTDPTDPAIWGAHWQSRYLSTWKPWPEGGLERMLWLASLPPHLVGVLTGTEQDALSEVYDETHRNKRPNELIGAYAPNR